MYPGTTNPERTQPKRRFMKQTTSTPAHTVVTTELARLPSGRSGRTKSLIRG